MALKESGVKLVAKDVEKFLRSMRSANGEYAKLIKSLAAVDAANRKVSQSSAQTAKGYGAAAKAAKAAGDETQKAGDKAKQAGDKFKTSADAPANSIEKLKLRSRELRKELEQLDRSNPEFDKTTTELQQVNRELVEFRRTIAGTKGDTKAAEGSYEALRLELNRLKKEYKLLGAEARDGFPGKDIQTRIKGLDTQLKTIDRGIGDNRRNVGNYKSALSGLASEFGVLQLAGPAAFATIAIAAKKFADDSLREFGRFETGISEVFTLLPDASDQALGELSDDLQSFSLEVGRLTSETTPALYQALSAGVPEGNVFEFLETASDAARGGVTELETAVDAISSVVNSYGEEVLSAGKASDVFFTTVRLGKTTFTELAANISDVAPIASELGISFGEVGAQLATITAQGVSTAEATTLLKNLYNELNKESSAVAQTFERLSGQSFRDFVAGGGSVQQALELLTAEADGNNTTLNNLFSNIRSGSAALLLTGKATETYKKNLEEFQNVSGATADAAGQFADTLKLAEDRAATAAEALKIAVGEALSPYRKEWLAVKAAVLEAGVAIANATVENRSFDEIRASANEAAEALDGTILLAKRFEEAWIDAGGALRTQEDRIRQTTILNELLRSGIVETTDRAIELAIGFDKSGVSAEDLEGALDRLSAAQKAGVVLTLEQAIAQQQAAELTEDYGVALTETAEAVEEVSNEEERGKAIREGYKAALDQVAEAARQNREALANEITSIAESSELHDEATQAIIRESLAKSDNIEATAKLLIERGLLTQAEYDAAIASFELASAQDAVSTSFARGTTTNDQIARLEALRQKALEALAVLDALANAAGVQRRRSEIAAADAGRAAAVAGRNGSLTDPGDNSGGGGGGFSSSFSARTNHLKDVAKAEEEIAKRRLDEEREIADARLDQTRKVADIELEASRKRAKADIDLEADKADALLKSQRDAAKDQRKLNDELTQERVEAIRGVEKIERDASREITDARIEGAEKYKQLQADNAAEIADLEKQLAKEVADAKAEFERARIDAARSNISEVESDDFNLDEAIEERRQGTVDALADGGGSLDAVNDLTVQLGIAEQKTVDLATELAKLEEANAAIGSALANGDISAEQAAAAQQAVEDAIRSGESIDAALAEFGLERVDAERYAAEQTIALQNEIKQAKIDNAAELLALEQANAAAITKIQQDAQREIEDAAIASQQRIQDLKTKAVIDDRERNIGLRQAEEDAEAKHAATLEQIALTREQKIEDAAIETNRKIQDAQKKTAEVAEDMAKRLGGAFADAAAKSEPLASALAGILDQLNTMSQGVNVPITYSDAGTPGGAVGGGSAGFMRGGYTGDGNPREVAGVVHRRELVTPAPVLAKGIPAILEHAMANVPSLKIAGQVLQAANVAQATGVSQLGGSPLRYQSQYIENTSSTVYNYDNSRSSQIDFTGNYASQPTIRDRDDLIFLNEGRL